MELRQLRYFAKVAECRSFSEASKALFVSQSSISQQVRQLEQELGVQLLLRNSHRVELSDAGKAFLPSALRTLADAESALDSIRNVKELRQGELNIGSTFTFSLLLGMVVRAFIGQYPMVKLNITSAKMDELMEMLDHGKIDVALSYRPLHDYPNIQSTMLFDNRLAVVMSATHPLASRSSISLDELQRCRLALPMRGIQARNAFETLVAGRKLNLHVQLEMSEITVLLELVASTHLVTLVSQATAGRHKGLVSIPLSDADVLMEGCYHVRSDGYLKYSAREFLRLLAEYKNIGVIGML